MWRFGVCGLTAALCVTLAALGQDGFQSGLQPAAAAMPATKMPHAFDVHPFNGKFANRFHCLVCENDIHPTLLLFLKEPADGQEKALESLFGKLDELIDKYQAMEKYPEVSTFAVFAVFLSPAAQTSLNNPNEPDAAKLVKEATDRRALYRRMTEWAGKVKKVVIATTIPDAVKAYKINPMASLTGIYYETLDVKANFAFETFGDGNVDAIVNGVDAQLKSRIAALDAKRKPVKN